MRKDITEQFTDLQSALEKFQQNVKKDIEEIRSQKDEIQRIKQDILDNLEKGRYIRDDNRIIISAPEIIIGNVDKSGILWGGGSKVVIRATNIDLEGVGTGTSGIGSIVSRAPSIRQIAVDPGKDGIEQVVKPISEIVSQAQNIVLRGENADDYFPQSSLSNSGSGIHLSTNGNGEERACPIRAVKDAVDATIGNAVCVFDSCKIFHIFEFAFASSVLHACCVIKHGANIRHFCIDWSFITSFVVHICLFGNCLNK